MRACLRARLPTSGERRQRPVIVQAAKHDRNRCMLVQTRSEGGQGAKSHDRAGEYSILGTTLDDSVGEAFDKARFP